MTDIISYGKMVLYKKFVCSTDQNDHMFSTARFIKKKKKSAFTILFSYPKSTCKTQ